VPTQPAPTPSAATPALASLASIVTCPVSAVRISTNVSHSTATTVTQWYIFWGGRGSAAKMLLQRKLTGVVNRQVSFKLWLLRKNCPSPVLGEAKKFPDPPPNSYCSMGGVWIVIVRSWYYVAYRCDLTLLTSALRLAAVF
jgi:hypothetical protein